MVTCSTNGLCLDKVAHGKTIKEVGLACDRLFIFFKMPTALAVPMLAS